MADIWTGNYQQGTYCYMRIKISYSGSSATATLYFSRTNSWSGTEYGYYTFTCGGSSTGQCYFENVGYVIDKYMNSVSFSINPYSSNTISFSYSGSFWNDFSGSITIPPQAVAPADPTISNLTYTNNSISFRLNESSWGIPASGRWEYYWGDASGTTANYVLNPTSGYTTNTYCDNTITGLTANTRYYIRYRVWNTVLNNPSGLIETRLITKPASPTNLFTSNVTNKSATLNWTFPADGDIYTKIFYYSLDNGSTWVAGGSGATSSATDSSCNITNLSAGTTYTIKTKVVTGSGTADGPDVTLKTKGKLYCGTNLGAKEVKKLYCSVNGQAKVVKKLYASKNGVANLIYQG